ncbi:hypothetical protein [Natrialba sp. INN-245]|uniref:hypothetical protein n=1 Tax=Natrialba sp. INN-245 TaxID=2690967 RepID=UPI0013116070|nr:hypothetical protein [Natrialba sp. INN-245]MWV38406.1 hypothetical protein [Natrialba sp. INN-245]
MFDESDSDEDEYAFYEAEFERPVDDLPPSIAAKLRDIGCVDGGKWDGEIQLGKDVPDAIVQQLAPG